MGPLLIGPFYAWSLSRSFPVNPFFVFACLTFVALVSFFLSFEIKLAANKNSHNNINSNNNNNNNGNLESDSSDENKDSINNAMDEFGTITVDAFKTLDVKDLLEKRKRRFRANNNNNNTTIYPLEYFTV